MFCCQLEELICWLYDVAELTDSWVPPTPDAASVKAALRRYLVGLTLGFPSSPWAGTLRISLHWLCAAPARLCRASAWGR